MQLILTEQEYNDLLKRAGNVDILAEEKLNLLKEDLYKKFSDLLHSNTSYHDWQNPNTIGNIIKQVQALLKT